MPLSLFQVDNICQLFETPEVYNELSKEELLELDREKKIVEKKKGEEIIQEGSAPKGVYYLINGTAKLFKTGFNGKEQILRFAKEGELIGHRSLLSNEVFGATAVAISKCEICFIPEKYFFRLLEIKPELNRDLLRTLSKELGQASSRITVLAQKTVRERLAEIILWLEKRIGTDEDGFIQIMLTREEMANLVGTATESAIRLISEFRMDKLIYVEGRKIKVIDHVKMQKLAHVDSELDYRALE